MLVVWGCGFQNKTFLPQFTICDNFDPYFMFTIFGTKDNFLILVVKLKVRYFTRKQTGQFIYISSSSSVLVSCFSVPYAIYLFRENHISHPELLGAEWKLCWYCCWIVWLRILCELYLECFRHVSVGIKKCFLTQW